MNILEAVLLGIIQGLTEWLPISSSGHLALAQQFVGEVPLLYTLLLHMGTTLVLIVFFRKEIRRVLHELAQTFRDVRRGRPFGEAAMANGPRRMSWLILLASVPTIILGFFIDRLLLTHFYSTPWLIGCAFMVTGVFLLLSRNTRGTKDAKAGRASQRPDALTARTAIMVGVAQSLALLPGISRSGATISTALLCGMDAHSAGRFSFLLAIPAVVGATLWYAGDAGALADEIGPGAMLAGTLTSIIVGYLSLEAVFRLLRGGMLHVFAPYCFLLGLIVIFYF